MSPQLANPIRLLLEYTGTPYEERKYRPGPGERGERGVPPGCPCPQGRPRVRRPICAESREVNPPILQGKEQPSGGL